MRKPLLRFDAEGIGDAVDVIEVGRDLNGVVDRDVRPADGSQVSDVRRRTLRRRQRHAFGVGQQLGHRLA